MASNGGDACLDYDPPNFTPNYEITHKRSPLRQAIQVPKAWFGSARGPIFDRLKPQPGVLDLTNQHEGDPLGERVILFGTVSDEFGRPVRNTLLEIWQANAAGRYVDSLDPWGLPLDPNFTGGGRCLTDDSGSFRIQTIRPAAYPGLYKSGQKGWRAAHVHFSFFGEGFESRLITQMYFEGDPLLRQDQIFLGIPDERARDRLVAKFDLDATIIDFENAPGLERRPDGSYGVTKILASNAAEHPVHTVRTSTAYRFDVILRGRNETPMEHR
jgi:protocatechuate 3,4-dioxygenase beta subunit